MRTLKIVGEYAERQKKAKPQGLETPFIFLPSWTPEPPNSNVTCKGINRGPAPKVLNTRRPLPYNCRHTYATMRAKFQHTSPFFLLSDRVSRLDVAVDACLTAPAAMLATH